MLNYNSKPLLFALVFIHSLFSSSQGQLLVGFYSQTCPTAESIVHSVVDENFKRDPGNAAVLLRLQFHDCFVKGCDGSILINNGAEGERGARGNLGVGGYEIIEEAKKMLESVCPGVVSCADIVALAARDAVSLLLKSRFQQKGLSDRDLVLLSGGAHTIGLTACFFMQKRLYNFTPSGGSDPSIDPGFLRELKANCPFNGDPNVKIPLDPVTEFKFDDQVFVNIKNGFAVIASDARLSDDNNTRQILESYIGSGQNFQADFAKAMVKMGTIGVKTGSQGEIRRVCSNVN
ncbi:hypothetical protein Patl1_08159 [Pistacia atlantica]|uniref:Uncharacterized protein n=1 Tax=Pistacia atlantica TaxID=434234 RepID=A0ACC1AED6_9ROSI|nr:hypothetical protein Patl1_08159 [Pistacia atlantica]